ncbi:MAG: LacI family DNA-binding transcriptional regulator [Kiritimatiellae bacterium]|nr:LacI family DNA-binding transcriptional regulator [Kiritimatiellia bacterium]
MTSMRNVAKKLNVSTTTVSRALNNHPGISDATRALVVETARNMGYDKRVGLRNSSYVGFIYPPDSFETTLGMYHAALFGGALSSLSSQGYDFALVDMVRDKAQNQSYSQFFAQKELKGVLIQSRPEDMHIVKEIADEDFPMVLVASHAPNSDHPIHWVSCESREPTRQAVQYLVELGHRRIGYVTGNWHATDLDDRLLGYQDGLADAGLDQDPGLIFPIAPSISAGMSVIKRISTYPNPPTAVMFATQYNTLGAIRACRELNIKIPEDLSIVGFDDYQTRFQSNPIYTSVCQDAYRLGYDAGQTLVKILNGKVSEPVEHIHKAVFEIHETTGPVKKS